MKPLRVAIITRRFWPLLGGPEKVLANLAAELPARSVHATILTARWQSSWSAELLFQDVPVVRLAPAPQGRCNTWRYLRSLARWLRSQRERLDLVYVSELRQEAYAAIGAVQGVPVVLRAERVGRRGDCLWQIDAPGGRRIKRRSMAAAGWWRRPVPPNGNCRPPAIPARESSTSPTVCPCRRRGRPRPRPPPARCGPKPIRPSNSPSTPCWSWPWGPCHRARNWTTCWRPGGRLPGSFPAARLWLVGPCRRPPRRPAADPAATTGRPGRGGRRLRPGR